MITGTSKSPSPKANKKSPNTRKSATGLSATDGGKSNQRQSVGKESMNDSQDQGSVGGNRGPNVPNTAYSFYEEARLQAAIQLHSTLEETSSDAGLGGLMGQHEPDQFGHAQNSGASQSVYSNIQQEEKAKGGAGVILLRLEKQLLRRLFQANHVLLSHQSVTTVFFHFILLLSFVQIIFNIFYKVPIINDFAHITSHSGSQSFGRLLEESFNFTKDNSEYIISGNHLEIGTVSQQKDRASLIGNHGELFYNETSTEEYNNNSLGKHDKSFLTLASEKPRQLSTQSTNDVSSMFRVDEYLMFMNFQFYAMDSFNDSPQEFIILYAVLCGIFFLFLTVLFGISGRAFKESKTEDVKEGTKIILKLLSIIMCSFLFLLQIPFMTILLQGFKCTSSLDETFLSCDATGHKVLIVTSTLMLIVFLIFIVCEQVLYTSNSFEQVVPWSSFESTLTSIRIFIKIVISASYAFDYEGRFRGYVNIVCFGFQAYIVIKRYQSAIIFNASVYYATIFYESTILWFYITVAIHILSDTTLTLTTLILMSFIAIMFAGSMVAIQLRKKTQLILEARSYQKFTEPRQYLIYFYRLYELIENSDQSTGSEESFTNTVVLQGKLRNHIQNCEKQNCPCLALIQSSDDLKKNMKLINQSKYDEEQYRLRQKKYEEDLIREQQASQQHLTMHGDAISDGLSNHGNDLAKIAERNASFKQTTQKVISLPNMSSSQLPSISQLYLRRETGEPTSAEKSYSTKQSFRNVPMNQATLYNVDATNRDDLLVQNWLAEKRRKQVLEEKLNQLMEHVKDFQREKKRWYQLMALLITEAIELFPKCIDLRVINAFIQKIKLANEFKAIFEMMNCELCNPTLFERFVIFRMKIEVEQALEKSHQKNIQKSGTLDVALVYNYEKLFQKYQLYEYLTTYSALSFWRELLQKHINSQMLQQRGSEISKYYEVIQDVADKLQKIYPNEIKFLFRYGNFLLMIIHNEYDGLENFRKAQSIYSMRTAKKGNSNPVNEQITFGENSSTAIIIIENNSTKVGMVIHANEEIESVLGFKKKDIIGKKVDVIIPRPIAKPHDKLIQKYFETAKPTVIEIRRQLFAATNEGYLREVELIVKVIPQVDDRIAFIGFIQKYDRFDGMEPVKSGLESMCMYYIVTDHENNITNCSEGLNYEIGLNSKFFYVPYESCSIFNQTFNISKICPDIVDPENLEALENEGLQLTIDTTHLLSLIDLESLTQEEILEIKANLDIYQAYVQLKRMVINSEFCCFNIYRVVILGRGKHLIGKDLSQCNELKIINANNGNSSDGQENQHADQELEQNSFGMMSAQGSMSSISSNASNTLAFNSIIKDFKKALGDRRTPKNLVMLNRIMIIIILVTIALSSIDFGIIKSEVARMTVQTEMQLQSESRTAKIVQLASNVRSFINIANGLEFETYSGTSLQPIDRYEYLGRLIQNQAYELQSIHQYLSQMRTNSLPGETNTDELQSKFEYEGIELYRLDDSNKVTSFALPYRIGLFQYINNLLMMNMTDRSQIVLPKELISNAPSNFLHEISQDTKLLQKQAYFLMVNGLRSLRTKTREASLHLKQLFDGDNSKDNNFLIIMILGTAIVLASFGSVLYQVWIIDRNKAKILSLYAYMQIPEIDKVFQDCEQFLETLNSGQLVKMPDEQPHSQSLHPTMDSNCRDSKGQQPTQEITKSMLVFRSSEDEGEEIKWILSGKKKQEKGKGDCESDEELKVSHNHLRVSENQSKKSKYQKHLSSKWHRDPNNNSYNRNPHHAISNNEIHYEMIKQTFQHMKKVAEREEELRQQRRAALLGLAHQDSALKSNSPDGGGKSKKPAPSVMNFESQEDSKKQWKKRKLGEQVAGGGVSGKQPSQNSLNKLKNKNSIIPGNKRHQHHHRRPGQKHSFDSEDSEHDGERRNSKKRSTNRKEGDDESSNGNENNHKSNGSGSSDDEMEKKIKRQKRKELREKQEQIEQVKNSVVDQEVEERNKHFFKSIKSKNWGKIAICISIGIVFMLYYIQSYVYHSLSNKSNSELQNFIPVLLQRFRYSMLSYAFLRERIINNKSLDSFEFNSLYGHDLDSYYIDRSVLNEREVADLKTNYPAFLSSVSDFVSAIDSEQFCSSVIGGGDGSLNSTIDFNSSNYIIQPDVIQTSKPYEFQIITIAQAQQAASKGDVQTLKTLQAHGVFMDQVNYDKRTPLHFAVKAGSLECVQYLISLGVSVNPQDRWGATPLNYAKPFPSISQYLQNQSAILGRKQGDYLSLASVYQNDSVSKENQRQFYAAFQGDLQGMMILNEQGKLNITATDQDGRTVLSVATSEGQLKIVKYLVSLGANIALRDARNNDALRDAIREQRYEVVDYLKNLINEKVIINYCSDFENGLLRKGLQQTLGNFHKRFSDLQIKINSTSQYETLLSLLSPPPESPYINHYQAVFNTTSIKIFLETQELYFHRVIDKMISIIQVTYTDYLSQYESATQIIFLVFLAFQLIILLILRVRLVVAMREDIFQSRGILNLIPDTFFEKNRQKVEKLIKILKD